MDIGIPKELRDLDLRVGLGTNTVAQLTAHGHAVYAERGAGEGAGFSDEEYIQAGATIVYSAEEVYLRTKMVCRVTTPSLEELDQMQPGQIICGFAHLSAASTQRMQRLLDRGVTVVAYEMLREVDGLRPIAQNEKMISINSAISVDLTGQVNSDSIGTRFYSGIGGQVDFVRGAVRSKGGKSIIAFPSTARGVEVSRIVPLLAQGAGVVTSRGDVHYVATEYGVAYLHGKTIRERARALINIAHPRFREDLERFAREQHYIKAYQ